MTAGPYDLYRVKQKVSTSSGRTPPARWSNGTESYVEVTSEEAALLKSLDQEVLYLLEWRCQKGSPHILEHAGKFTVVKDDFLDGDENCEAYGAFIGSNYESVVVSFLHYLVNEERKAQTVHYAQWLRREREMATHYDEITMRGSGGVYWKKEY